MILYALLFSFFFILIFNRDQKVLVQLYLTIDWTYCTQILFDEFKFEFINEFQVRRLWIR